MNMYVLTFMFVYMPTCLCVKTSEYEYGRLKLKTTYFPSIYSFPYLFKRAHLLNSLSSYSLLMGPFLQI